MAPRTLAAHLQRKLDACTADRLCVAFSGGPDSSALLHALAVLESARSRRLRALHVDHGLHPDSPHWAARCTRFCAAMDIPMQTLRVQVVDQGHGLEGAAREARYAALAGHLDPGERLLTAHHADDQAETLLLKLLRGAGPQGLGGMRELRALGPGKLWRPLLDLPRAALQDYLREHGIESIEDPSNARMEHARNFLRRQILPRLELHWPQVPRILGHSARLSAEAADFIDAHASVALADLYRERDASLDATGWLQLHRALRGLVLERWLHARGLPAPTHAQRHELERQVREAAPDRIPEVTWPDVRVRNWRGRLYAHASGSDAPVAWRSAWNGEPLDLPGGGRLRLERGPDATSVPTLEVRLGQTGVRLRPRDDAHTRDLRDLFQRAAIPPWQRRACPLIHAADGHLLAVADLWMTDAGAALFGQHDVRPRWEPES